ncbi:MAG: MFS transporter [Candidatus Omnitrophota bacterium]|jgi:MFS family permease
MEQDKKIQKSLAYSLYNGVFSNAMLGFFQHFLTPFLLVLGGTARQVGVLNAFPSLLGALTQLKSADLIRWLKSRKKAVNIFVILEGVILLSISAAAFLKRLEPSIFIVLIGVYAVCSAVISPALGSWISDLVNIRIRGSFFGKRSRIYGFVAMGSTFAAGLILNQVKIIDPFYGFAVLFGTAFIFRMLGWMFIRNIHEPLLGSEGKPFTIFQFIGHIKHSNFARFVLFVSLFGFSVNIASPFFAVLMLKDLKFSYLLYTVMIIASALARHISISRWGEHADRVGNLKILRFTSVLIGMIPFLWIICRNPLFLILVQVFSGFLWSGFNLCASNFIYDAATPEKRPRCIAYFNALNGIFLAAGAFLGGFLVKIIPGLFGYRILALFLVSAVLRFIVVYYMRAHVEEVRHVEKISHKDLFYSMININPVLGIERKTIKY